MSLLFWPDERLSKICDEAPVDETTVKLIGDLQYYTEKYGGAGLAAPQIGVLKRVVVCRFLDNKPDEEYRYGPPVALVNPELIEHSDNTVNSVEGCLSLPSARARIGSRWTWIVVSSFLLGEDGAFFPVQKRFSGPDAVMLQHEMDHLDGKTLLDRVGKIKRQVMEKAVRRFVNKNGVSV